MRSHCGAQRKVFNWGLAQIKDTVAQREAERSYGITAEELAPSLTWSAYLLADPRVSGIVVEHRDRRARFGVEQREAALAVTGGRIIVVNPDGVRDDVVRDMTRGRGRRCVLAGLVAGLLVAARRRVSGALLPRW